MKKLLAATLLLVGCGTANYTVLSANIQANAQSTAAQATSWPSLSTWESKKVAPNDVAVIVAIEDYAFLPDVAGAVQNANDWEQYFRVNRGMENVFVLANQDAPIEEIRRFIGQAVDATQAGSALWFVFIGHGAAKVDGTDGVLIGMDAQQTIESLSSRAIAKSDVVAELKRGKQSDTIMVLDTCFSGRSPNGELLAQGTQPVIPVSAAPALASGFALLSAAKGDQVAGELPGAKRPAFSYLLLGALRGWGDANGDDNVTASEAVNYAQKQLRLVKGRQQTPEVHGETALVLANGSEKDPGVGALISAGGKVAAEKPPANAPVVEGDRIDTNKGIVVPVLEKYALPEYSAPGFAFYTQRMTERTIIAVAGSEMGQLQAANMIAMATEEAPFESKWIAPPVELSVGEYDGTMMSYKDGHSEEYTARFLTYQNGQLWTFQMTADSKTKLVQRSGEFKKFIELSGFK